MVEIENCFYINIIGQIESCWFPIGFSGSKLFCRYDVSAGPDWKLVSGLSSGVSQCACASSTRFEEIIFNMPIELMYKSTNPYGCKLFFFFFLFKINRKFMLKGHK